MMATVWLVEDLLEGEMRPALRMVASSPHRAAEFVRLERESLAADSDGLQTRDKYPLEVREVETDTDLESL